MRIRIVGIGSARGDDAAGLAVAERLSREAVPPRVAVTRCEVPGFDLVEALSDVEAVLIVDAVRSGRSPGSVHCIEPGALRSSGALSSHALGVAEALGLAEALGRCAPHVEIVGIEIGPDPMHAGALSPAVQEGVGRACRLVRERLEALSPDSGH